MIGRTTRTRAIYGLSPYGEKLFIGNLSLDKEQAHEFLVQSMMALHHRKSQTAVAEDMLKTDAGVFDMSFFVGIYLEPMP